MDVFWAAPPVTRTLTAGTLAVSALTLAGIVSGYWFIFYLKAIYSIPPQLWRFATCFMIARPQLGHLIDPYTLYTYGSRIETGSPRFTKPGDFMTYVLFVCSTIVALTYFFTGGFSFTPALILAFVYTGCQDDRGGKSTFIVITIPSQWVPFAMLFVTYLMDGPGVAKIQATGLVAAHLYDFLTRLWPEFGGGRNMIPTPAFIRRMFQTTEPVMQKKTYGTSFTPAQRQATGSSTGAAGSVLPESWKSRGSGHRLGGD